MPLQRRPLVVLTDSSIRREAAERLRRDCSLRSLQDYPSEHELIVACRDADALLARLAVITGPVIEAAPRLRIIAKHGAGSDGVDLPAATARGIVVTTTGSVNAGAVAEYTIALLLGLLRKIPAADAGMRTAPGRGCRWLAWVWKVAPWASSAAVPSVPGLPVSPRLSA